MPALHTPETLERSLVIKRGIFTVPEGIATVNCDCAFGVDCAGLNIHMLAPEHRDLELEARQMTKKFIRVMTLRGLELKSALSMHGPWVSYDFEHNAIGVDDSAFYRAREMEHEDGKYADPSHIAALAFERDPDVGKSDYLIAGYFVERNQWTERIVEDD